MVYQTVLFIQYISIIALFIESWIVLEKWRESIHSYLFFSCAATLINNIGYLKELLAETEDEYITALQFSYAGRIWIPFAMFLFLAKLCKIAVPHIVRVFLAFVHIMIYVSIFTVKKHSLYYRNMHFVKDGIFPQLLHKNGILHHVYTAMVIFFILLGLFWIFRCRQRETNPVAKKSLLMVILAVLAESMFYILRVSGFGGLSNIYDLTQLGFPAGALFMFFAIFRYNLLDAKELAKEYVVDELSEGIVAVDGQGNVSYYNKPAVHLFPELQKNEKKVIRMISDTIRQGEVFRIEDRIIMPEENELSQKGSISGRLYALRDDTEHFHYMEELKEQKSIADKANQAKSAFLSNMSHEIRTPINAVLGMDEMILREAEDESIIEYAENIRTSGTSLLGLINDILDFSKIEAGKMDIIPVEYAFVSVLNDLINLIRQRAEAKGLELIVDADAQIPRGLFGDEVRFKQIVTNILTNAVKYTEQGSVTIHVDAEKTDEEHVMLHVSVQDTGIGIKQEDIQKLFSAFERIEEERNRNIEGTGLGMNITKQLLAMMDSRLEVKSVYGEGSDFSFRLRQKVTDWTPIGNFNEALKKSLKERKHYKESFRAPEAEILVVDDTAMNLVVFKGLLKQTRVQIDTAENGLECLEKIVQRKYDLIFLDHRMPKMDGIETKKRMLELPDNKNADTPVIALTANAVSGAREEYLGYGFSDYLAKPIDSKALEKMMIEYLPPEKVHLGDADNDRPDMSHGEAHSVEEDNAPDDLEEEEMESLPDVEGIDWNYARLHLPTAELLKTALGEFYQVIESHADRLDGIHHNLPEEDAWDAYRILVHGMKSSAATLGIVPLAGMAKVLEFAARDHDIEKVQGVHKAFLEEWRSYQDKLLSVSGIGDRQQPEGWLYDKDVLKGLLEAVKSGMEEFEVDQADAAMEEIRKFQYPDALAKPLEKLRAAIIDVDDVAAGEIIEAIYQLL